MAASVLLGILSGLSSFGNSAGEAQQIQTENALRKMQEDRAQAESKQRITDEQATQSREAQSFPIAQQRATQQLKNLEQEFQQRNQPQALGNPFTSGNGKTYQRYQDPNNGAVTTKEVQGPTAETPPEQQYRGLVSIGIPEEDARKLVAQKITGHGQTIESYEPDATSPTGISEVVKDKFTGEELWRTPSVLHAPTTTSGSTTDQLGLTTNHVNTRTPQGVGGRPALPQGAPAAAAGPIPLPRSKTPQQTTAGTQPGAPAAPAQSLTVGTYRGLTPDGLIPPTPGLNPGMVQYANDLMQGRDAEKIPSKARPFAESLAKRYGWKGQGSLSPKQQLQVQEADTAVKRLMDPNMLKLFDGGKSWLMTIMPDEKSESALGRIGQRAGLQALGAQGQQFLDSMRVLKSLMGSLRSITGGNPSEAQVKRFNSELPDPTSTANSADAKYKLALLARELAVAKQYGYFPRGDGDTGAPPEIQPTTANQGPQRGDTVEVDQ